jgi:chromosome segregation ATPase
VIEPIMIFGIGFLVACLFGLVLVPLIHNRAVRLTTKRLEAATPLSMAELQADKDQLRAEFAMSMRRLELLIEQLKAESASQLAEIGKKTDATNRLKVELREKIAEIQALQASEKTLRDRLQATENELSDEVSALHQAERLLVDKETEIAKLTADLEQSSAATDSNHIEIAALQTLVEALKDQINDLRNQIDAAQQTEADLAAQLATARRDSEETRAPERAENALLRERINDIAAEIARLTIALEEPVSPIEALLAGAVDAPNGGDGTHSENGGGTAGTTGERRLNLGDRIRALQSRASRLSTTN